MKIFTKFMKNFPVYHSFFIFIILYLPQIVHSNHYQWDEGSLTKSDIQKAYLVHNMVVVFPSKKTDSLKTHAQKNSPTTELPQDSKLIKEIGDIKIYEIPSLTLSSVSQIKNTSPLFTTIPDGDVWMALPGGVEVLFKSSAKLTNLMEVTEWAKKNNLTLNIPSELITPDNQKSWSINSAAGISSLQLSEKLRHHPDIERTRPIWWIPLTKK
jgi:hypothetical protein